MNEHPFARRERCLLILLGFICIGLIVGALYLQYAKHEDPCPLCIIQRYFFILIAIFAFSGAMVKRWRGITVFETLIAITAIAGIGVAAHHLYIQLSPGFSCGFDAIEPVINALPPAQWLPGVFKVRGLCEMVYPPIFGILLPGWSLIAFVFIFVFTLASLWCAWARKRRKPGPV